MKFSYLLVRVRDIDASLKLYCDVLGMELERRMTGDGADVAFVVEKGEPAMLNKAMLELVKVAPDVELTHSGYLIGFQVPDLDAYCARMQAHGYAMTAPPYSPGEGYRIAHFAGPDGEAVGLMQIG